MLIDIERPSPLWMTSFPRQRTLNCVNIENELSTTRYAYIDFSLLDVMW